MVTIKRLGCANVHLRRVDGFHGWPGKAPFDAILLRRAVEEIPKPLWDLLGEGGRALYPKDRRAASRSWC